MLIIAFLMSLAMGTVRAQEKATIELFLNGILLISAEKCGTVFSKEDDIDINDAVETVCACMPDETKILLTTLGSKDLTRAVTSAQFQDFYKSAVIDKCAAKQFRMKYGDKCEKRFEFKVKDPKSYCGCMRGKVADMSDAELSDIGVMAADYLPLAARAKRKKLPPPDMPMLLKIYFSNEQKCGA